MPLRLPAFPLTFMRRCERLHVCPRKSHIDTSIEIGKYLVSPLVKRLQDGRYAASVSIRSGRGSATHDRVLRLIPLFDTAPAAIRYATEQGLAWVGPAALLPVGAQ